MIDPTAPTDLNSPLDRIDSNIDLEVKHGEEPTAGAPPLLSRLLWRGLTKRCPACGQGRLFVHWFTMRQRCRRCGLEFERIEGH